MNWKCPYLNRNTFRQILILVALRLGSLRICLFVEKKLAAIKHFLLNFFWGGGVKMCDKMAISDHVLKIVEKDPFLRLQMRLRKCLIITNFFPEINNT